MDKKLEAVNLFNDSKNCAQSVIGTYANDFNLEKDMAFSMSTAFGGGMGHSGSICGALSGGLMVLGLKCDANQFDKEKTYALTRHLMDEFVKRNGTRDCEELIGVDLTTEEGKKKFKEENIKKNICEKCIKDVIDIIEEIG